MAEGAYIVSRDIEDSSQIIFQPKYPQQVEIPSDQVRLHLAIEEALNVLRSVFKKGEPKFNFYFLAILGLAQAGLVGLSVHPEVSMSALNNVKNEIVMREGPIIKNNYLRKLGYYSIVCGSLSFAVTFFVYFILSIWLKGSFDPYFLNIIISLSLIWSGCMLGCWLSFGIRKPVLSFNDLAVLEEDQLEPKIRLIFAGFLSITFGLLFCLKIISLKFGPISTDILNDNGFVAFLLGILLGISEKAMPSRIAEEAKKIVGGK